MCWDFTFYYYISHSSRNDNLQCAAFVFHDILHVSMKTHVIYIFTYISIHKMYIKKSINHLLQMICLRILIQCVICMVLAGKQNHRNVFGTFLYSTIANTTYFMHWAHMWSKISAHLIAYHHYLIDINCISGFSTKHFVIF